MGSVNWERLGTVNFDTLQDVWDWAELGEDLASDSAFIVLQARKPFHEYMKGIALDARGANRRAMRITRKLNSAIDHLAAAKKEFGDIPAAVLHVFDPEITAANNRGRKRIDLTKGV